MRPAGDDVSQPRRCSHDRGKKPKQSRVGLEQRKKLHASRQPCEERIEAYQRVVCTTRLAECLEQGRRQVRQAFSCLLGSRRAVAAEMPSPDNAADIAWPLETEALQRLQCIGIVDIACKDEIANAGRQFRRGLEQRRIVTLDLTKRIAERRGK